MGATTSTRVRSAPSTHGERPRRPERHLYLVPPLPEPPVPVLHRVVRRLGLEGLRLTRRGRVVLVLLLALLLAPAATWGASAVASAPGRGVEVRVHAVQPGESLWDFAARLTAPGHDVRPAVGRLQELNDLDTASLRVGQLLLLPVE